MRVFVFLYVMLLSINVSAQIGKAEKLEEYIEVGDGGSSRLEYKIINGERQYLLIYKNSQYANIVDMKSISFISTIEDLEYLYNTLKSVQGAKDEKTITVGNDRLIIKPIGKKWINVLVYHKGDTEGFFYLTPKQLDKLFGQK